MALILYFAARLEVNIHVAYNQSNQRQNSKSACAQTFSVLFYRSPT
jgi:hypothetical protein